MNRYVLPLGIFLVLLVFLGIGLGLNPREIPSPLIDKPAPAFELAELHQPGRMFATKDMLGKVWLLNVWASAKLSFAGMHEASQWSVNAPGLLSKLSMAI